MGWPVSLPAERRPEAAKAAIERYLDGERIADIAASYGLSDKRLYALLTETAEDEWKSAQVGSALEALQQAKDWMQTAQSMQDIARAREAAKLAQWDLERVCRRIYGTDAPPQLGQGVVQININLGSVSQTESKLVSEQKPEE